MLAEMDDVWDEVRVDPQEFTDGGDRVVVIGRLVARGRAAESKSTSPITTS
jgi:hypothetical protein